MRHLARIRRCTADVMVVHAGLSDEFRVKTDARECRRIRRYRNVWIHAVKRRKTESDPKRRVRAFHVVGVPPAVIANDEPHDAVALAEIPRAQGFVSDDDDVRNDDVLRIDSRRSGVSRKQAAHIGAHRRHGGVRTEIVCENRRRNHHRGDRGENRAKRSAHIHATLRFRGR